MATPDFSIDWLKQTLLCPKCGQREDAGPYCIRCGAKMIPGDTRKCPACEQTIVRDDAKFCWNCGFKLT